MSDSTISTLQLFQMFPDESTARLYLEGRRWPKGTTCPTCGGRDRITTRKREGFYRCNKCQLDFTVRTGTVFERSHIPLHKWIYAMYLLVTARKGISSMQLAKDIGVTLKSAWFMIHRLREACGGEPETLQGADSMRTPKVVEKMVDVVLRCHPESKVKPPRERKRRPKPKAAENKETGVASRRAGKRRRAAKLVATSHTRSNKWNSKSQKHFRSLAEASTSTVP